MERWRSIYHFCLAGLGALWYRFPAKKIFVVAVTGTKGKTTTIELINTILETAGFETALSSTLRFKIGHHSEANQHKMTMPGRLFLQKFLRQAVAARCDYAIIEMTSEGAKQHRHRFIELDALIFTNLSPEHIESHGSYEKYLAAKLNIAQALERSAKPNKVLVVNGDDQAAAEFLKITVPTKLRFGLSEAKPITASPTHTTLTVAGEPVTTPLLGTFNLYNILAAASFAQSQKIKPRIIKQAIEGFGGVRGRLEPVGRQTFEVFVDYAHTPDSLKQVYEIFKHRRLICLLGGTGGGRDHWKRPAMGQLAGRYCHSVILTNEDPYDEDPVKIVREIAAGVDGLRPQIIMDRRLAIREAIKQAKPGNVVLITGKGTDPYIMGPRGLKTAWDDAEVVRQELKRLERESNQSLTRQLS